MISEERIVNERFSAHQELARDQALIQRLGCAINTSQREDRRRRTKEAGEEVKILLGRDPPPPSTVKFGTR